MGVVGLLYGTTNDRHVCLEGNQWPAYCLTATARRNIADGAGSSLAPVAIASLLVEREQLTMREGTEGQASLAGPLELTLTRNGSFVDATNLAKILRDPDQEIVDAEPKNRATLLIDEHNKPRWSLDSNYSGRIRRLPDILYKVSNDSLSKAGAVVEMYGSDKHAELHSRAFYRDRPDAPSIVLKTPVLRAKDARGDAKRLHIGDMIRITEDENRPGGIVSHFAGNSNPAPTGQLAPLRLRARQEAFCVSINEENNTVDLMVRDPESTELTRKTGLRLSVVNGGKGGFSKFDYLPATSEDRFNVTLIWNGYSDRSPSVGAEHDVASDTEKAGRTPPNPEQASDNTRVPVESERAHGEEGGTMVQDTLAVGATEPAALSGRPGRPIAEPTPSGSAPRSHEDDIKAKVALLVRPTLEGAWSMSATFDWQDLSESATAVLKKAKYPQSYRDFLLTAIKQGPDLLKVKPGQPGSKYIDKQLLLSERDIIEGAVDLSKQKGFELPPRLVADVAREGILVDGVRLPFTSDLTAALKHVSGRERATVLNGAAGSGKSMVIGGLAEVVRRHNAGVGDNEKLRLIAYAPTHKAAEELRKKNVETVDTLYQAYKASLEPNTIVVVDEMSMAKTIELAPLVRNVMQSTFEAKQQPKIIFVGHELQLPAVGLGDLFPEIIKKVGPFNLTRPLRQETEEWADKAQDLAENLAKNPRKAIEHFLDALHEITEENVKEGLTEAQRSHGIQFVNDLGGGNPAERRARSMQLIMTSVDDFDAANLSGSRLMMAHSNDTVNAGNEHLHSRYVASEMQKGTVEKFQIRATIPKTKSRQSASVESEYSRECSKREDKIEVIVGDSILFNDNSIDKGIRNGVFATVTEIKAVHDSKGRPDVEITARLNGSTELVTWLSSEFRGVTRGDTCTVHKSQAEGRDNTAMICDGSLDANLFYVGVTRNKKALRIIVLKSFAENRTALAAKAGWFRPPNNALKFHGLLDNENSRLARAGEDQTIAHEQPTLKRARYGIDDDLVPAIETTDRDTGPKRRKLHQDSADVLMTDAPPQTGVSEMPAGGRVNPPEQATPAATGHVADGNETDYGDFTDGEMAAAVSAARLVEPATTASRTAAEVAPPEHAAPAATGHVADSNASDHGELDEGEMAAAESATPHAEAGTTAATVDSAAQSNRLPLPQANRGPDPDDDAYFADDDEPASSTNRGRGRGSELSTVEATAARNDAPNKRKREDPELDDRSKVEVEAGDLAGEVAPPRKRAKWGASSRLVSRASLAGYAPVAIPGAADDTASYKPTLQHAANDVSTDEEPERASQLTRRLRRASQATTSTGTLANSSSARSTSAEEDRAPRTSSR